MLFYVGGEFDLLFGFNRTNAGFTTLVLLFFLVPVLNLSWLIAEITLSVNRSKQQGKVKSILMPSIAVIFLMESIAIDLYLLLQVRI